MVLRLHIDDYYCGVDLTISYAHARPMGTTDDEGEESWYGNTVVFLRGIREQARIDITDGAFIHGDELIALADGRFVHRFWLSWPQGGAPGVDPQQPQFAIEFDDAAMSLHIQGRLLDLGQPKEAIAAVEEMIAPLRQREAANPDDLLNKRRLADLVRLQEALAATEEAAALDP